MKTQDSRTCYITSLKYSPGLAKEFELLGRNLRQHGWTVRYLISSSYSWLIGEGIDGVYELTRSRVPSEVIRETALFPIRILPELRSLFGQSPPHALLIYNSHPLNVVFARLAQRVFPGGVRTIYLHEPFVPEKLQYGRVRAFYIYLVELLQALTLRHTTCALVPSEHSRMLFDMRYSDYDKPVYTAPILLPDRLPLETNKRYVSLVGNLNQARNSQDFIRLVNFAVAQEEHLEFKILTRSDIGGALQQLSPKARAVVEIVNKSMISDEEIAAVVSQSIALFLPHKQAAQSGNVPVSFREGTPIIARDIPGLSQHVHHKVNGYLFPINPEPEQLLEATLYVRDNLSRLSAQAREDFDSIFSESNWERYYSWLIQD